MLTPYMHDALKLLQSERLQKWSAKVLPVGIQ